MNSETIPDLKTLCYILETDSFIFLQNIITDKKIHIYENNLIVRRKDFPLFMKVVAYIKIN